MIAYKISNDPNGVFCAIFESFTAKEKPIEVFSGIFQPSFDCAVKVIENNPINSERVRKGIIKCGGISLLSALYYVLRSNDDLKETIVFNAAYKCLQKRKNLLDDYSDPDILAFYELKSKIGYEAHRLTGFIRFEKSVGGIWYAHFTPDNDVVDLIAPHFKNRFINERFILHDVTRNKITVYNGKELLTFLSDQPITVYLDKDEIEFQKLWQSYFNSVNIKERKNLKQQDNYLPRRYRKNMSEFLEEYRSPITTTKNEGYENFKALPSFCDE